MKTTIISEVSSTFADSKIYRLEYPFELHRYLRDFDWEKLVNVELAYIPTNQTSPHLPASNGSLYFIFKIGKSKLSSFVFLELEEKEERWRVCRLFSPRSLHSKRCCSFFEAQRLFQMNITVFKGKTSWGFLNSGERWWRHRQIFVFSLDVNKNHALIRLCIGGKDKINCS